VKSAAIAGILSLLNDECGRLNDGDWEANKGHLLTVLRAYDVIGKIRAEDVDHARLDRINGQGGALSWNGRGFDVHPDRCECQGADPIPHRHYDHAPYGCARCSECKAYSPVRRAESDALLTP
jgi:hypothetical protein